MKISDIKLEMELYGVDLEDITEILEICKAQGYDAQALDDELEKKGYEPIFILDEEEDDENEEYSAVQKFTHKKNYID